MRGTFLRKASTVCVGAAVLACMLLALTVVGSRLKGYELLAVQSDSMRPLMSKGTAVLVDTRDASPRLGDVVSYQSPEDPRVIITHRVIGADYKRGIISTKGDATALTDSPVPAWNVIGTVHGVLPGLGFALDALKHPLGLIAVVYLPAVGIIVAEVRRLSGYYSGKGSRRYVLRYYAR
jgi:signal peptidase